MRSRLREADRPQPAFIEVNGDLRAQRVPRCGRICRNPAEPVIRIARANKVPQIRPSNRRLRPDN
jgi:hypothetical protein